MELQNIERDAPGRRRHVSRRLVPAECDGYSTRTLPFNFLCRGTTHPEESHLRSKGSGMASRNQVKQFHYLFVERYDFETGISFVSETRVMERLLVSYKSNVERKTRALTSRSSLEGHSDTSPGIKSCVPSVRSGIIRLGGCRGEGLHERTHESASNKNGERDY